MLQKAPTTDRFRYVYRKDLGYYVVNLDDPYWDPEKKQMRHRYTMVGKSKTKNGPIEFGPKYRAKHARQQLEEGLTVSRTLAVGEILVLSHMQNQLALKKVLISTLGREDAEKLLGLAYYSICTGEPLSYAQSWFESHGMETLSLDAPRISELLHRLNDDVQKRFFALWLKRKGTGGAFCYDITSVSSYGKDNDMAIIGTRRSCGKSILPCSAAGAMAFPSGTPHFRGL
jgi:hypothetical protein